MKLEDILLQPTVSKSSFSLAFEKLVEEQGIEKANLIVKTLLKQIKKNLASIKREV